MEGGKLIRQTAGVITEWLSLESVGFQTSPPSPVKTQISGGTQTMNERWKDAKQMPA